RHAIQNFGSAVLFHGESEQRRLIGFWLWSRVPDTYELGDGVRRARPNRLMTPIAPRSDDRGGSRSEPEVGDAMWIAAAITLHNKDNRCDCDVAGCCCARISSGR